MKYSDLKKRIHNLSRDSQIIFISFKESEELILDWKNIFFETNPTHSKNWMNIEIEIRYLLSLGLLCYSGISIEIKER
jgi:hypothetical protein